MHIIVVGTNITSKQKVIELVYIITFLLALIVDILSRKV